jgi:hypothetical protein
MIVYYYTFNLFCPFNKEKEHEKDEILEKVESQNLASKHETYLIKKKELWN